MKYGGAHVSTFCYVNPGLLYTMHEREIEKDKRDGETKLRSEAGREERRTKRKKEHPIPR